MPQILKPYDLAFPNESDKIRDLPEIFSRMANTISNALARIETRVKEAQEDADPSIPTSKASILAARIQQVETDAGILKKQAKSQSEKIKALESRIEALEKGASTPSPAPPEIQANEVEITWSGSNSRAEITGGDASLVRSTTGGQVRFAQNVTARVSMMEIPGYSERKAGELLLAGGTRKFMPYGAEDIKAVFTKA